MRRAYAEQGRAENWRKAPGIRAADCRRFQVLLEKFFDFESYCKKRLQQGKQLLDLSHLHTFGFGLAKPAKNPKGFFVLFGVCYVLSKKKDAIFGRYYFKKGENYPL